MPVYAMILKSIVFYLYIPAHFKAWARLKMGR